MGLAEQIRAGATLQRSNIQIVTDGSGYGSASLGATYALLTVQTSEPCRLRLYDNLDSLEDATEISRTFGNTNVPPTIALIGDFSMSEASRNYSVDPMLYAVVDDTGSTFTYYRIDGAATPPVIQIGRYLMQDVSVVATGSSFYAVDNRRSFTITTDTLSTNELTSGSLTGDSTIPVTYLLVSASLDGAGTLARVRLYSNSSALYDATEKARSFENEPAVATPLIVDAFLSGDEITYFAPKIVGANLENMGSDLTLLRSNNTAIQGNNELYYIIENKGGSSTVIDAMLHLYALED